MQIKMYDFLIVGAGVVGASIFNDLVRGGYRVAMIDKASDVATGASKANSGLVHAGFDPKPGTLKALLNVKGNALYPSICKRLGVPLKKTGAVVVGKHKTVMLSLLKNGKANGVENLSLLERDEIVKLIPNISDDVKYALYAKDAYIVSPYLYTICLAEEAVINGGNLYLEYDIKKCVYKNGLYYLSDGTLMLATKTIINAAGAGYNDVAKILGSEQYPITFKRGEYYVLDSSEKNLVNLTVFPEPTNGSKGVLVTPTIDGNILVGPTSIISDKIARTTKEGLDEIKQKSILTIKNINLRKTIRVFSGLRSISGEDFIIEKSLKKPAIINIAGVCSPGLSAAPAISRYVLSLLGVEYKVVKKEKIKPYILMKDLSISKRNEMIKKNPSYGKIVCKCEEISEGEIIDALNRPIAIKSIDGVKRRVRAGMGRCQGGFCADRVAEIIAAQRNIPLENVMKENKGSYFISGNIREKSIW